MASGIPTTIPPIVNVVIRAGVLSKNAYVALRLNEWGILSASLTPVILDPTNQVAPYNAGIVIGLLSQTPATADILFHLNKAAKHTANAI